MYNPSSLKAEEFIDHNEVMDTLEYAAAHADDVKLIEVILKIFKYNTIVITFHTSKGERYV